MSLVFFCPPTLYLKKCRQLLAEMKIIKNLVRHIKGSSNCTQVIYQNLDTEARPTFFLCNLLITVITSNSRKTNSVFPKDKKHVMCHLMSDMFAWEHWWKHQSFTSVSPLFFIFLIFHFKKICSWEVNL